MNFSFKKNIVIIVIAAVLALGIGGTVIGVNVYNSPAIRISRYLGAAERYLSEMNYEQAIIEFQNILEIEPMNVDAYLGLAEAYIGLGDTEKALEILREGLDKTGDPEIQKKINELTKPMESSSSAQSSAVPAESKPEESNPVFGSMGTAIVAGTEIDIATTESLFIINKELYEAGNWHYVGDLADYAKDFDSVINLSENLSNDDLSELSRLSNLKNLQINYAGISDISFLEKLTNLNHLNMESNSISDITPLTGLTNLKILYLERNKISDLAPLAGLTNLTNFGLDYNQISDITPLAGLTNLTDLGLFHNPISDIKPLAGLTNLTNLDLGENKISDTDRAWLNEQLPNLSHRI